MICVVPDAWLSETSIEVFLSNRCGFEGEGKGNRANGTKDTERLECNAKLRTFRWKTCADESVLQVKVLECEKDD